MPAYDYFFYAIYYWLAVGVHIVLVVNLPIMEIIEGQNSKTIRQDQEKS